MATNMPPIEDADASGFPVPPLPPRPPEPKSIHQMTPEEMHESLPVHLRRRRPDGTYVVMGLISRMQQDLEDLTQGKRAATYPEVDEYLGYALLAEGLAPRWLSAADAVKWWRNGGSAILEESPDAGPVPPDELQKSGLSPELAGIDVPRPSTQSQFHNALFSAGQSPLDGPVTGEQTEALGFAPAVFQRPLPGFLSSGGDDEDDASLIQVGLQGGRLGRGPFGPAVASRQAFIQSLPPIQYLRSNAYDHATRQMALLSPQATYTIQSPTFVPTFDQVRQRNEELVALRWSTADTIAKHAFESHILGSRPSGSRPYRKAVREFPEIRTIRHFKALIYETLRAPTYIKQISGGRNAFWYDKTATVVIINTSNPSKSTAFQPDSGVSYYQNKVN